MRLSPDSLYPHLKFHPKRCQFSRPNSPPSFGTWQGAWPTACFFFFQLTTGLMMKTDRTVFTKLNTEKHAPDPKQETGYIRLSMQSCVRWKRFGSLVAPFLIKYHGRCVFCFLSKPISRITKQKSKQVPTPFQKFSKIYLDSFKGLSPKISRNKTFAPKKHKTPH